MSLRDLVNTLNNERARLDRIVSRSERAKTAARKRIAIAAQWLEIANTGLNVDLIELAKTVLSVRGNVGDVRLALHSNQGSTGVRTGAVAAAIKDIAENDTAKLRREYVGVKNYDHFGDQRADCSYGCGPRHGSIVFQIGLTETARKSGLTPDETEAALYYLLNLADIQTVQAKAV